MKRAEVFGSPKLERGPSFAWEKPSFLLRNRYERQYHESALLAWQG